MPGSLEVIEEEIAFVKYVKRRLKMRMRTRIFELETIEDALEAVVNARAPDGDGPRPTDGRRLAPDKVPVYERRQSSRAAHIKVKPKMQIIKI